MKKTLDEFVKLWGSNWKENVLYNYELGKSDIAIINLLNISKYMFYRLRDDEKQFKEVIEKGKLLSQGWWEEQGRSNLSSKDFNSTLWFMNMKNRFGWSNNEKVEHTGEIKGDLNIKIHFIEGNGS